MTRLNAFRWIGAAVALITVGGAFAAATGARRFAERRYAERTAASAAAYLAAVTPPPAPGTGPDVPGFLNHARALAALPGWTPDVEVYLGTSPLLRATNAPLSLATLAVLAPAAAPRWLDGAAYAPIAGPGPGRMLGVVRVRPDRDASPVGPWLPGLVVLTTVAGLGAAARMHRRRGTWWLGGYATAALVFGGVAAGTAGTGLHAAEGRWMRETALLIEEAGSRLPRTSLPSLVTILRPLAADGRLSIDSTGGAGEESGGTSSPGTAAPRFIWFGADRWLMLEPPRSDWAVTARDAVAGTAALAGVLALLALTLGASNPVLPGQTEEALSAWMFLAPAGLHLIALTVAPLAVLVYVAVHRWDLAGGPGEFVGLDNLFTVAAVPATWLALGRTALFVLHVPLALVVALALALAIHGGPGRGALTRALLAAAPFVSLVAAGVVCRQMLVSSDVLDHPGAQLGALVGVATLLQIGYLVPLFLTGLRRIPDVLWDAAALDGAPAWTRFRRVIAPLLGPVIRCALATGVALAAQGFTLSFVIGGNRPEGDLVAGRLYRVGWVQGRLDLAAAVALLFTILIAGVAASQIRIWKRGVADAI